MRQNQNRTRPTLPDELVDTTPEQKEMPLHGWRAIAFVAALILVALNLRPALSSLSPVLAAVQVSTGLHGATAGLLTTAPVMCLGLFAPLAPKLARRFGPERVIFAVLFVLGTGTALRGLFGTAGLFAGAIIAGASIGVIGVLLPGIVKREFPQKAAMMTGVYTMALCIGVALAAGLTVPLKNLFGNDWRPALAAWSLLALIAAAAWWPFRALGTPTPVAQPHEDIPLWRDRLAWHVTLYMGLQSSLAYCVFGWLPSLLQSRGISALEAGAFLSSSVMVQILTSLSAPWISGFFKDQRPAIAAFVLLTAAGLMGALYAPVDRLWLWLTVLGLGQGGAFSMALTLIVLRAPSPAIAARLSGMVQGVGYTLASLGPFLVGAIHEIFHAWEPVGVLFAAIAFGALVFGLLAGRNGYVLAGKTPVQH